MRTSYRIKKYRGCRNKNYEEFSSFLIVEKYMKESILSTFWNDLNFLSHDLRNFASHTKPYFKKEKFSPVKIFIGEKTTKCKLKMKKWIKYDAVVTIPIYINCTSNCLITIIDMNRNKRHRINFWTFCMNLNSDSWIRFWQLNMIAVFPIFYCVLF